MNGQASRLIQLRQLEINESKSTCSKVISICSGKGGTGKTFFSANFAFTLASQNKRVLLVDFDLNLSNLNFILNKKTDDTLSEFFEQRKSLPEIISKYNKNLHLIFGDSGREDYPRVSKEIIDYFFISLNKIATNYDFIILDSSAGASDLTLHQLLKSEINILVTSTEPTAIMDAYVVLKLLKSTNSTSEKLVVLNKSTSKEEAENSYNNLFVASKHFLDETPKFIGHVSFDYAVHKSVMDQQLLVENDSSLKISSEILSIANQFTKITQVANNNQKHLHY